MPSSVKYLLLFLASLLACPGFILFHELRHYAVALAFGAGPQLHYARTTVHVANATGMSNVLVSAAGPVGDALIGGTGLLWLYCLRRKRRAAPATGLEWCATLVALPLARWLRGFGGSLAHPQPPDEAFLSHALGMPAWLLPYLLAVLCVIPVVMLVRLHPPRARLLPFLSLSLGGVAGLALWMRVVGPCWLP